MIFDAMELGVDSQNDVSPHILMVYKSQRIATAISRVFRYFRQVKININWRLSDPVLTDLKQFTLEYV